MAEHRFPPPWSVEQQEACFVVRDHNGQQLAYLYFEDEPGWRSAAKLLSKDEARKDRSEYRKAARYTVTARVSVMHSSYSMWYGVLLGLAESQRRDFITLADPAARRAQQSSWSLVP
jgi:hypothetical protein